MAATQSQPNIWAQMAYTPPRGCCSQKTSMVSSCACHRFMIHPLKAATSFECDGCGHHASFHRMENPGEEAIAQRLTLADEQRRRDDYRIKRIFETDPELARERHKVDGRLDTASQKRCFLEAYDAKRRGDLLALVNNRRQIAATAGESIDVLNLVDDEESLVLPGAKKRKARGTK